MILLDLFLILFLKKKLANTAEGSTTFSLSNYLYMKDIFFELSFGILGFSEFGEISDTNVFDEQEHQYGFQFEYEFELSDSEIELSIRLFTWLNRRFG